MAAGYPRAKRVGRVSRKGSSAPPATSSTVGVLYFPAGTNVSAAEFMQ
jgi:hypothetical protein